MFPIVIPLLKVDSHVLLTRPPLRSKIYVRLACVKHTASVHPEPGSNSLKISRNFKNGLKIKTFYFIPIIN